MGIFDFDNYLRPLPFFGGVGLLVEVGFEVYSGKANTTSPLAEP
jgi:hypothetical protein